MINNKDNPTKKIYDSYISTHFGNFNKDLTSAFMSRYYLWKSYLQYTLPRDKKSRILEIGCGMGHNLFAFKKLGFTNVIGFDISKECVSFCKEKHFDAIWSPNITSYRKMKGIKNTYTFIVVYDLFEHLDLRESMNLLKEIKSMLTPDGKLFISVPNGEFPFNLPQRYIDITHTCLYTPASLTQLLHVSGFIETVVDSIPTITSEDEILWKKLLKKFILYPLSELSLLMIKLFFLTLGITLNNFRPQLYCVAKVHRT